MADVIPGHAARLLVCLLLAGVTACDIPTAAPHWNTNWVLPVRDDSMTVTSLLPSGVAVSGGNFTVDLTGGSVSETLGNLCGAGCPNGATIPKPAFTATISHVDDLPSDVGSVTPGAGTTISVRITNNLGFDPIRPSASARGVIVTSFVDNDGDTVAVDSLQGSSAALASGTSVDRVVALPAGQRIPVPIAVATKVVSPAGDAVTINTSATIAIQTVSTTASVAGAEVRVVNQSVSTASVDVDLSGVDQAVSDRVDSASIQLRTANPFAINGTLTARFDTNGVLAVSKLAILVPGTQTQYLRLTRAEIQGLLGQPNVQVSFLGTATGVGVGNMVAVTPLLSTGLTTRIILSIPVGSTD